MADNKRIKIKRAEREQLAAALQRVAELEYAAIPEEDGPLPEPGTEELRRETRRGGQRGWRLGAVLAVLLLAVAAGTFSLSPPARAGIMQIFRQQGMSVESYGAYDKLVFSQPQSQAVLPEINVGYLPEGWGLAAEKPGEDGRSLRLLFLPNLSAAGSADWSAAAFDQQLEIRAAVAEEGLEICLQNRGFVIREAAINGCPARIYEAEAAGAGNVGSASSYIMWLAADGRVFFMVDGALSVEELMAVAESIVIEE